MHELGIAASILKRVKQVSAPYGDKSRVTRVGVRIGELSAVDPEALTFGFEALSKGSPYEGTVLEIDFRKRVQRCTACQHEFETETFLTACPSCGSAHTRCIAGDELDITFIELEEAQCA